MSRWQRQREREAKPCWELEDEGLYTLGRGRAWHFPFPWAFITLGPVPTPRRLPLLLCLVTLVIFYWKRIVWGVWGFLVPPGVIHQGGAGLRAMLSSSSGLGALGPCTLGPAGPRAQPLCGDPGDLLAPWYLVSPLRAMETTLIHNPGTAGRPWLLIQMNLHPLGTRMGTWCGLPSMAMAK